jgi:hypothetical protein
VIDIRTCGARIAAVLLAYLRLVSCYGRGAERVDLRGMAGGVVTLSLPAGRACRLAVGRQDGQGQPARAGHGAVACRSQGCRVDRGAEALRHAMVQAEAA